MKEINKEKNKQKFSESVAGFRRPYSVSDKADIALLGVDHLGDRIDNLVVDETGFIKKLKDEETNRINADNDLSNKISSVSLEVENNKNNIDEKANADGSTNFPSLLLNGKEITEWPTGGGGTDPVDVEFATGEIVSSTSISSNLETAADEDLVTSKAVNDSLAPIKESVEGNKLFQIGNEEIILYANSVKRDSLTLAEILPDVQYVGVEAVKKFFNDFFGNSILEITLGSSGFQMVNIQPPIALSGFLAAVNGTNIDKEIDGLSIVDVEQLFSDKWDPRTGKVIMKDFDTYHKESQAFVGSPLTITRMNNLFIKFGKSVRLQINNLYEGDDVVLIPRIFVQIDIPDFDSLTVDEQNEIYATLPDTVIVTRRRFTVSLDSLENTTTGGIPIREVDTEENVTGEIKEETVEERINDLEDKTDHLEDKVNHLEDETDNIEKEIINDHEELEDKELDKDLVKKILGKK